MPTTLPPVTQTLLNDLQQTRAEQIATLSKLLNLSLGTSSLATVEKIAPITQPQRDLLLTQSNQILTQLNINTNNPAIKVQINNLLEQRLLLNSPLLKLVQLQVNGRELLTYTDKPVQPGQLIPVKLDTLQRLVQIAPAFDPADAGQPIKPTPEQAIQKAQTQQMLATVLRNLLPQKDKPQELFTALSQLQQLPPTSRNQLLSSTLQQALKTVADQLRAPQQLANPKLLPMILKNSGVQFEHKLAAQLPPEAKPHSPTNPLTRSKVPTSPQNIPLSNRLTTQDLKGALLQLLHRVNQELGNTSPQAVTQPANTAKAAETSTVSQYLNPLLTPGTQPSFNLPIPFDNLTQLLQLSETGKRDLMTSQTGS
jgi:hypothetical protein